MLTKYFLHTPTLDYELKNYDLKNWNAIQVSYKRDSYGGVSRSFSSQFEFTNTAREILLDTFLREGLESEASIEIRTLSNEWEWEKAFECQLDFSTLKFDNLTLSLNAIDNSLSALIKANKSTKYEFEVGVDIPADGTLHYDRIPMLENVTYQFTQGAQYDNGDLSVAFKSGELPFMGVVASEISVGHQVMYEDDQTSEMTSYLIQAVNEMDVTLDFNVAILSDNWYNRVVLWLCVTNGGTPDYSKDGKRICELFKKYYKSAGNYDKPEYLPNPQEAYDKANEGVSSNQANYDVYAVVDGIVWENHYNGMQSDAASYREWINTGKTEREYLTISWKGQINVHLKQNQKIVIMAVPDTVVNSPHGFRIIKSSFTFSWNAIGEPAQVDMIKPETALDTLLSKITDGKINAKGVISDYDKRISKTWLSAAESARGLEGAKFYSSFNDFCEWMETVFGYVYYLEEPRKSPYTRIVTAGRYTNVKATQLLDENYTGDVEVSRIVYYAFDGRFFYRQPNTSRLYPYWPGWENFNDPTTLLARTDTLFRIQDLGEGLYMIHSDEGLPAFPEEFHGSEETIKADMQNVVFIHRSELYEQTRGRTFSNVTDFKYELQSSQIFSSLKIGYNKVDYDSINGRDEFNFNNVYSTGCYLSDKSLQLISKYRADCYGFEFAVQKRGEDSSDSSADNDVFFILCGEDTFEDEDGNSYTGLVIDRTDLIEGALNDRVFNGAFSPMACVEANQGYISLQSRLLNLFFASSEGNSSISINGQPMNGDIFIESDMLTNGVIEFKCGDVDNIADENELISVTSGGITYRGFLQSVDIKYSKPEEVKYKLIVKDITI